MFDLRDVERAEVESDAHVVAVHRLYVFFHLATDRFRRADAVCGVREGEAANCKESASSPFLDYVQPFSARAQKRLDPLIAHKAHGLSRVSGCSPVSDEELR